MAAMMVPILSGNFHGAILTTGWMIITMEMAMFNRQIIYTWVIFHGYVGYIPIKSQL